MGHAEHHREGLGAHETMEPTYQPLDDLMNYAQEFARQRPGACALWIFALGFIVGWRLKPW